LIVVGIRGRLSPCTSQESETAELISAAEQAMADDGSAAAIDRFLAGPLCVDLSG
jgi:hypothetical protein